METEKQTSKFKSPFKSNKYKTFLTSFLSPSVPKRPVRRKDSKELQSSQSIEDVSSYKRHTSLETSHHSSDSIYSTIEIPREYPTSGIQSRVTECASIRSKAQRPNLTAAKSEPLYAAVNKKTSHMEKQPINFEMQELKEDNDILRDRIKDVSEDNRILRKKLQDLVKEEKLKEDTLHSNLQLKITELEAETRKEVKSLSDRIQILIRERESLNDQIDILELEKKALQIRQDDLCNKLKTMVSADVHRKTIAEHQKSSNDVKRKHAEEINKLEELCNIEEESKTSLEKKLQELKDNITIVEKKNEALEKTNHELLEEKSNLLEQTEESKHMEQDMQALLLSLLKVTEAIAMERNVLLNKTSFQDLQQKEIQTTVIDYSLNIGRLQEHILNLNKDNHQELMKFKTSKYHHDENLQQLYGKQLDILRGKILAQHNTINDLENDKRKLESQLELIWQAACGSNSMLLDEVKAILHKHSHKEDP